MLKYEDALLELNLPGSIGNQKKRRLLELIKSMRVENENLRAAQRWIPVAERLPKDGETVIVLPSICGASVATWWRDNNYFHLYELDGYIKSPGSHSTDVTHWMPLPAQPK